MIVIIQIKSLPRCGFFSSWSHPVYLIEYLLTVHKKLLLNSYANFLTLLLQTECLIDMWLLDNKNFSYPDQFVKSIIACQTRWREFGKKEFGKNVKHVGQKIKKSFLRGKNI